MERKHKNGVCKPKSEYAAYMREYRIRNKDLILEKANNERKENPLRKLWKQIATRKKNLNISREDFMKLNVPSICPALGIPISFDLERDNFPSVDRIDPNKPYEVGNIAIISYRANMIKSVGSLNEHLLISKWLENFPIFDGKPLVWGDLIIGATNIKLGRHERI